MIRCAPLSLQLLAFTTVGALVLRAPCSCTLGRTARAPLVPRAPRPPVMSLADRLTVSPPPDEVVRAVERVVRRRGAARFTASDLAAEEGMSLPAAQRGLTQLASALAGADGVSVAASQRGELLYSFPRDTRLALAARSGLAQARELWGACKPVLARTGRAAFGLSLFVSIAVVFAAIVVIAAAGSGSSSSSDNDNDRSSSGSGGSGGLRMYNSVGYNSFVDGPSYTDIWLRPRPYYASYWQRKPTMSMLEAIFSFVFGDGDPNLSLKAVRTRTMASVVRDNGCAVVADQLAPFLDPPADPYAARASVNVDESWVLPACLELGGRPEVSDDGTLVYVFDDMAVSAAIDDAELVLADARLDRIDSLSMDELRTVAIERRLPTPWPRDVNGLRDKLRAWAASANKPSWQGLDNQPSMAERLAPKGYLEEKKLGLSEAEPEQKVEAALLGGINLASVGYLGWELSSLSANVVLPGWVGVVAAAYPLLVVYALSFLVIPATRMSLNMKSNQGIDQRNTARRRWAEYLRDGDDIVKKRLRAARGMSVRPAPPAEIVYDSAKDVAEQSTVSPAEERWVDKLRRRISKS